MDDLRQSLQRIPSMGRKAILKELIEIEEDIDAEGAVRYSQELPVSEQVFLVTSLMNGSSSEELIKGVTRSLPVDSLQLLAYNLLRGCNVFSKTDDRTPEHLDTTFLIL